MKELLEAILNCALCHGQGINYWSNGEDYDMEYCDCNPYRLILDGTEIVSEGDLSNAGK